MKNIPTFGINGFGRIGRTSFRVWWLYHRDSLNLKAINTSGSMDLKSWIHLIKYDTNYSRLDIDIKIIEEQSNKDVTDDNPILGKIEIEEREIIVTAQRDPAKIPWEKYGVETVLECTGVFNTAETASAHLKGGAKRVIISAPTKGESIQSHVMGIGELDKNKTLTSNASCTTNCVAPVIAILHEKFGIQKAMLTTIHAYTDDQNTQDNSHKKDLRRARSAAENIIPTSTGAAKATTQVIPELKDKFDGLAIRVPVKTGSLIDVTFLTKKDVTKEEINQAFIEASQAKRWQGILSVTHDPIVSSDIVGTRESSIVDLELTNVVGGNLVKVISWYDNEFGYCNRLIEQILGF